MPPFFLDRNVCPDVTKALKVVRSDIVGHEELFEHNAPDEHIARELAARGYVWITRDKNLMRRPRQRRVMLDAEIPIFVNTDGGNLTTWDFFQLLVRRFPMIEARVADGVPGIYVYTAAAPPHLRWHRTPDGRTISTPLSGETPRGGRGSITIE